MIRFQLLLLIFAAACGGDDDAQTPNSDGGTAGVDSVQAAPCGVRAMLTADVPGKTVTGLGKVECDAEKSIKLEVCVQWRVGDAVEFEDVQCMEQTMTGAELEVSNVAACGISPGTSYRAVVNSSYDGTDLPQAISFEALCE